MDITRAKEIIELLADGVNPLTGEVLSDDDCCNQVEVVRALHTVLCHLSTKNLQKELPKNAGKPWTKEDDKKLQELYSSGMTKQDICIEFNRSFGSITSRLKKLGLVSEWH